MIGMLQVSVVLDWIRKVFGKDDLNMETCGVTTVMSREGRMSWEEIGQKFLEGRQVWR